MPGATRPGWGVASVMAFLCVRRCPWFSGTVFLMFPQTHSERTVNFSLKLLENSRISDLEAFKFPDILSSLMKPPAILLRPAKPRISCLSSASDRRSLHLLVIRSPVTVARACVRVPLVYSARPPKCASACGKHTVGVGLGPSTASGVHGGLRESPLRIRGIWESRQERVVSRLRVTRRWCPARRCLLPEPGA